MELTKNTPPNCKRPPRQKNPVTFPRIRHPSQSRIKWQTERQTHIWKIITCLPSPRISSMQHLAPRNPQQLQKNMQYHRCHHNHTVHQIPHTFFHWIFQVGFANPVQSTSTYYSSRAESIRLSVINSPISLAFQISTQLLTVISYYFIIPTHLF